MRFLAPLTAEACSTTLEIPVLRDDSWRYSSAVIVTGQDFS
jgi:hypothetical protein